MTSFNIMCFVAAMSFSISETTQLTEIRTITLMLKKILEIPHCKQEHRTPSPHLLSNECDIKLRITEAVSGIEMPSIRLQRDVKEFNDTFNLVGTHISMTIRKGVKMNLTIKVYDYDQHNYNPDRLLMTISAAVDLEKNEAIQYRACNESEICREKLVGKRLEKKISENFDKIAKVESMLIEFTVQSNAVSGDINC